MLKRCIKKAKSVYTFWLVFDLECNYVLNENVRDALIANMFFRFKATLYPCPENPQERNEMLNGVSTRLEDLKTVRTDLYLIIWEYRIPNVLFSKIRKRLNNAL